jgi:hypothetical protein
VRFFKAPEGGSDGSSESSDEVRVLYEVVIIVFGAEQNTINKYCLCRQ